MNKQKKIFKEIVNEIHFKNLLNKNGFNQNLYMIGNWNWNTGILCKSGEFLNILLNDRNDAKLREISMELLCLVISEKINNKYFVTEDEELIKEISTEFRKTFSKKHIPEDDDDKIELENLINYLNYNSVVYGLLSEKRLLVMSKIFKTLRIDLNILRGCLILNRNMTGFKKEDDREK